MLIGRRHCAQRPVRRPCAAFVGVPCSKLHAREEMLSMDNSACEHELQAFALQISQGLLRLSMYASTCIQPGCADSKSLSACGGLWCYCCSCWPQPCFCKPFASTHRIGLPRGNQLAVQMHWQLHPKRARCLAHTLLILCKG